MLLHTHLCAGALMHGRMPGAVVQQPNKLVQTFEAQHLCAFYTSLARTRVTQPRWPPSSDPAQLNWLSANRVTITLSCMLISFLELQSVSLWGATRTWEVYHLSSALHQLLQHVPALLELVVWGTHVDQSALSGISSMQHLQACKLYSLQAAAGQESSIQVLQHLPATLTRLEVGYFERFAFHQGAGYDRGPWTQQVQQLSGLQALQLGDTDLDASVLTICGI